jgi:hypothetical protein
MIAEARQPPGSNVVRLCDARQGRQPDRQDYASRRRMMNGMTQGQ